MNDVTIMGLNRVSNPRPNKGGSTVLAWFDCQVNGFLIQGCAFVRTARRGLTVWPPKIDGPESTRRSVTFADEKLRKEMVREAQSAYRALGGTDGEWIRHDEEDAEEAAVRYARERTEAEAVPSQYARERQSVANVASVAGQEAETADPARGGDAADGLHRFLSTGAA